MNQLINSSRHEPTHRRPIARTQFGQIMNLATKNNERFIVDRRAGRRYHERAGFYTSRRTALRLAATSLDWRQAARPRQADLGDIDGEIHTNRKPDL
jgi:hypothetical protein